MKKITLARALKIKNILVGKIAKVKSEITDKNSVIVGTQQPDILALLKTYNELVVHIIDLKTIHYKANLEIQRDLYELAETKSTLAFYNTIDTSDGDSGQLHYGTNTKIVNTAAIKKEDKDKAILELESSIESLQEKIDKFNYQTEVSVNDSLLVAAGIRKESVF